VWVCVCVCVCVCVHFITIVTCHYKMETLPFMKNSEITDRCVIV